MQFRPPFFFKYRMKSIPISEKEGPSMAKHRKAVVECRSYALPAHFPILALAGERWRISDVPSGVLHFHNCMEIGLCKSESATLEFADTSFPCRAGSVTVLSRNFPHTTYSAPGCASKWSYLFVDPEELLHPFLSSGTAPNFQRFTRLLDNYRATLSREDFPTVWSLASGIVREMLDKRPDYEISVRGLFLVLMTELTRIHFTDGKTNSSDALPIAAALEYVNRHYSDNFSVDDLAVRCQMSASHFRRIFKGIMGAGPLEYVNRVRIFKACALLRTTEDSILQISEQVGFHSLSSFGRHFVKAAGKPPGAWRKGTNPGKNVSILKCSGWLTPPRK
jgi:AraC-like DNA-binding protein